MLAHMTCVGVFIRVLSLNGFITLEMAALLNAHTCMTRVDASTCCGMQCARHGDDNLLSPSVSQEHPITLHLSSCAVAECRVLLFTKNINKANPSELMHFVFVSVCE